MAVAGTLFVVAPSVAPVAAPTVVLVVGPTVVALTVAGPIAVPLAVVPGPVAALVAGRVQEPVVLAAGPVVAATDWSVVGFVAATGSVDWLDARYRSGCPAGWSSFCKVRL